MNPDRQCAAHREPLIAWPMAHVRADRYLEDAARNGVDLDSLVETFSEAVYPGVTRAEMALVLHYRRRWGGWPTWSFAWGDATPELPAALYGRTKP